MELPCLSVGRAQGPRDGISAWPWGGGGVEGWRKGFLGCCASMLKLNFQFFHTPLLPWAAEPSHFLPSVMGVSGEPLCFLAC